MLAEETKDELLRLTDEKDDWKIPVTIDAPRQTRRSPAARTVSMSLLVVEGRTNLRLDVHLSRGIEHERFKRAVTTALLYERALKNPRPGDPDRPLRVPPWLADGLREATAWRLNQSDRRLYEALFKSGGLFKIDELFAVSEAPSKTWTAPSAPPSAFPPARSSWPCWSNRRARKASALS